MAQKLTDAIAKSLPVPASGNRITYDDVVAGFGIRVTAAGARSFVLNYHTRHGQERRLTIGKLRINQQSDGWSTAAARQEADRLRREIDQGNDPLAKLEADRSQKTVAELCKKFLEESRATNTEGTAEGYEGQINNYILPILKAGTLVMDVEPEDVQNLHRKVSKQGGPYAANRVVALVSHMFNRAIVWNGSKLDKGWARINPTKGTERNPEQNRERYVDPRTELAGLLKALEEHEDRQAVDILKLAMLTGCRKGEALKARWDQFKFWQGEEWSRRDLDKAVPSHKAEKTPPHAAFCTGLGIARRDSAAPRKPMRMSRAQRFRSGFSRAGLVEASSPGTASKKHGRRLERLQGSRTCGCTTCAIRSHRSSPAAATHYRSSASCWATRTPTRRTAMHTCSPIPCEKPPTASAP